MKDGPGNFGNFTTEYNICWVFCLRLPVYHVRLDNWVQNKYPGLILGKPWIFCGQN